MHASLSFLVPFASASICIGLVAVTALPAQTITTGAGSSGVQYFSESRSAAAFGNAKSTTYTLSATFGQIGTGEARSSTYTLTGGFPGTLQATSAAPWLTAALPTFITPRSQDLVWLSGTRLFPGIPTVSVSGQPATVIAHSATDVAVRMPNLAEPGWHEITLRNSAGETSLERGIGVLPLLYTDRAGAPNIPFDIVFKGTRGDSVLWVLGLTRGPLVKIGSFLHGLAIDPAAAVVLNTLMISANTGELKLEIPASPFPTPLYIQGLFLSNNPGYAPGSFSNLLEF